MKTALRFFGRIFITWLFAFLGIMLVWNLASDRSPPGLLVLFGFAALVVFLAAGAAQLRSVRLIVGDVDLRKLANRQQRQIEIPFDADTAFDMVEASIRELPHAEDVKSVRTSLQIRAKVRRVDLGDEELSLWHRLARKLGVDRNQVFALLTPREGVVSVTLVCEPEGGAWMDWFMFDNGTNLVNADAITRAITRRIAQERRGEQAATQETKTEKELAVAKLGLLHAQVEPHFLYNTLGSAKYLIQSDPVRAEAMLDNLILYLRNSLPRTEDSGSTLGEELARARAYLEILQIRMGERLQLQIDVPENLNVIPFPTMMLQTLVENAIKHGLEPKPAGGTIWIRARVDDPPLGGNLTVTVADDGCGVGLGTGGTGIGLKNVRERLKLAYDGKATFAFTTNFPTGVAATIVVPTTLANTAKGNP